MYINLDNLLKASGNTRYWLAKETGITYANIRNLCNNTTKSINFDVLENICSVLDCTPNDILIFDDKDKTK